MNKRLSLIFDRKKNDDVSVQDKGTVEVENRSKRMSQMFDSVKVKKITNPENTMERTPDNSDTEYPQKILSRHPGSGGSSNRSSIYNSSRFLTRFDHKVVIPLPISSASGKNKDKTYLNVSKGELSVVGNIRKQGTDVIQMVFEVPESHSVYICYDRCWMLRMKDAKVSEFDYLDQPWLKFTNQDLFLTTLWNELEIAKNFCVSLQFRCTSKEQEEQCYIDAYHEREITKEVVERFIRMYSELSVIKRINIEGAVYAKYSDGLGAFGSIHVVCRREFNNSLSHQVWIFHDESYFLLLDNVNVEEMPQGAYQFYIGNILSLKNSMTLSAAENLLSEFACLAEYERSRK